MICNICAHEAFRDFSEETIHIEYHGVDILDHKLFESDGVFNVSPRRFLIEEERDRSRPRPA
jgi:hypothetical protein